MDGRRFDHLAKRLKAGPNSRRGLLRLGVGGGLGLLVFGRGADEALACRRTKKPCAKRKRHGDCCSGTCKKGKCRPTLGAAGCQVTSGDICRDQEVPCPNDPNRFCAMLDNGKPFCLHGMSCSPCTTNADCTTFPNGKCVKTCTTCPESNGRACFYPQT